MLMENSPLIPVKVCIGGEVLQIKTDGDPDIVHRIAAYLESQLGVDPYNPKPESRKDFLLLAMNVAGELFETRKELEKTKQLLAFAQKKTEGLVNSLADLDLEEEKNLSLRTKFST